MSWTVNAGDWVKQLSSPFYNGNSPNQIIGGAIPFPLPAGNFIPAKMPMHLVYPRPNTETSADARHRWAHPDMEYTIPIGVQGGSWPFKYEIVSAPTGATIGQFVDSSNYGVIKWTPTATSGTETFTVRITDQEQNTVDATWTVAIDASKFVFIEDGYTGTKVGTIDQPLEDISDWYISDSDNTYAGRIVVLRSGNYSLGQNISLNVQTKTRAIIGFPNTKPIVNCSQCIVENPTIDSTDIFIAGIRWENARQDVANSWFLKMNRTIDRLTVWGNYFFNHNGGTVDNDNSAALYIPNAGFTRENILYKNNVHDQFTNNGNGGYVDIFSSNYVLVEGNEAKNSDSGYGFWMKGTKEFITVRDNKAIESVSGTQIVIGYGAGSNGIPSKHEVCWNYIVLPYADTQDNTLRWADSNFHQTESFDSFVFRNTFVGGTASIRFAGIENYKADANLIINNQLSGWDTSIIDTVVANVTGNSSSGIVDSQGLLTGASRTTWLGKIGHEILN